MLNLDLHDMEATMLPCVNPFDVIPINGISACATQEEEAEVGKKVKLEMEEFSDLAPFLPASAAKKMANSPDELNTPVFERKGPFDFMIHENTYTQPLQADDPFKFEYDTIQMGTSVLSDKQINDFSVYSDNICVQLPESNNNSEIVNVVQGSEANVLYTTSESDIFIINGNETPIHLQGEDQISASIFKIEDSNSVVSANSNENQYSNVSSPSNDFIIHTNTDEAQLSNVFSPSDDHTHLGIETPEDSNSYTEPEDYNKTVPKLSLSCLLSQHQPFVLNTPDVIDSVVQLESSFNILDYVNEKDITTVNIEDIQFEEPSTSTEELTTIKTEPDRSPRIKKRPRKYEDDDDDDEDYVPPSKKSTVRKSSFDDEDSESEGSFDLLPNSSKSQRRTKRTDSVSSDHSDASKYRELRDKNNEASRKSRMKRKIKELTLEKEADGLEERNIKLKAQVAELEKMVNNFRNNLFKIMLKK